MIFSPSGFGLRFRLMGLVVLAMLPMVGMLIYHAAEDREQELDNMQAEATRIADLAAGSVSQVIEGTRQVLFLLAYSEPVRRMDASACNVLFREWLEHSVNYYNIGLAKSADKNIASAIPIDGLFVDRQRAWFMQMQERRDFSIGEFQISRTVNKPTIVLSYPLLSPSLNPDEPVPAVYAALNLDLLQNCISRPQLASNTIIAITDRNGIELARNPDAAKWVGHLAKSWPVYKKEGGKGRFVETAGVDGVVRLYTYVPVPGSDKSLFVNVGVMKESIMEKIRDDFLRNLRWMTIFTLAALVGTRFVADVSVLKHVRRLTDAAYKLTAGQWETRATLTGGARELQQLSHAFDEMAAELRRQRDSLEEQVTERTRQLSRVNQTLVERINERMEAESASQKLLAELKRSNQELEQFAYVASHDLQEPLRLVSAYTQLLLNRYQDKLDHDAAPMVHFITEGVARMQQLIQDLLAYSRVTSQNRPLTFENLEGPFESALHNLAMVIQETQATVTHDPLPSLFCNPTLIGQLFQNLIANGIKFRGKQAPAIHVGATKNSAGSVWLFSVRDNGIGIEPEYFERIFVIFQRLHTRAKYPGTGIGLAICKRIVEHHGGKIWVESTKGEGCTFFFTISNNPERV